MFHKALIKTLQRENARLRGELRRREQRESELIDNFIFHRTPERFLKPVASTFNNNAPATSLPSDAYSVAVEEAERMADLKLNSLIEEVQDDDA